jgi:hypothetical protein
MCCTTNSIIRSVLQLQGQAGVKHHCESFSAERLFACEPAYRFSYRVATVNVELELRLDPFACCRSLLL